jgi:F-type H+-transporting ATPase subunit b
MKLARIVGGLALAGSLVVGSSAALAQTDNAAPQAAPQAAPNGAPLMQQPGRRPLPPGMRRPAEAAGADPLHNRVAKVVDPNASGTGAADLGAAGKKDEEAEPAEAENEEGPPKAINWTDTKNKSQSPYVFALINFLVLAGIYWYFGKGPVSRGLQARHDEVAREIAEAQRMKEEAQERAKTYQAKLANLESELEETKKALVDAGKTERERIVKEAEEKAERIARDANLRIEQEMKQIRDDLRRETVEIAIAAAEELLQKRMTDDDQSRLADEYLTELVAKTPRASVRPVGSTPAVPPATPSTGGAIGGAT